MKKVQFPHPKSLALSFTCPQDFEDTLDVPLCRNPTFGKTEISHWQQLLPCMEEMNAAIINPKTYFSTNFKIGNEEKLKTSEHSLQ